MVELVDTSGLSPGGVLTPRVGSSPTSDTIPAMRELFDSIAQLVEQRPLKPLVAGSSPARVTKITHL